jgi:O-acetyl-ADP-ribose deacetylase (regulator of RNase III)
MSTIQYVMGDATAPTGDGNKIIVHICNDVGGWGRGFVVAISKRWPEPEASYRAWYADRSNNDFALGAVQLVKVTDDLWVANIVGQHQLKRSGGLPPIRYDAVRDGLAKVATFAAKHKASVHMPRIGCGLAGGTWDEIEPIIEQTLVAGSVSTTVYDFAPR